MKLQEGDEHRRVRKRGRAGDIVDVIDGFGFCLDLWKEMGAQYNAGFEI